MTRKAHLEAHFSSAELKARYLSTIDKVERRRWHLLWLASEQWTIKQAAKAVLMSTYSPIEAIVGILRFSTTKYCNDCGRRTNRLVLQVLPGYGHGV